MDDVYLVGRLTKDCKLSVSKYRTTGKEYSIADFTLACKCSRYAKKTVYVPCVSYGNPADVINKYTRKGSLIAVTGGLENNSYTKKNGESVFQMRVVVEKVELLGKKPDFTQMDTQPTEGLVGDEIPEDIVPNGNFNIGTNGAEFMNIPDGMDFDMPFN